jgi:nitrate reductase (NAD(P)H)
MVSPEESASNHEWWKDDRYAIYDLSVNSAIAYPAHEERVSLVEGPEKYQARGYAYGGGGRRITRVEISLDKGRTWRLANIEYAEDRYRDVENQQLFGGKIDLAWRESCFCWCFWSLDIPISELRDAADVFVRAMDEAMNIQPRDMYWSVLGMMNNPWFRVTITQEGDELRFEHPTQPALMPGGWMERVKKAGGDLTNGFWGERTRGEETALPVIEESKEVVMVKEGLKKEITIEELKEHEIEEHPWFVLNGEVYDGTGFLKEHPGGAQSIVSAAGLDSTEEFMAIRQSLFPRYTLRYRLTFITDSETAKAMMPDYHIGTLDEASRKALAEGSIQPDDAPESRPIFLNPRTWTSALLTAKEELSHDTRLFTFQLSHPTQTLGLPTGQHLMIRLVPPGSSTAIIRPYTPLSRNSLAGKLEVLVKIYPATASRAGGAMTVALDALPLNTWVDFKGPIGKFTYLGRGRCSINGKERTIKRFIMVCAGSGVTPILAVLRAVVEDEQDETRCLVVDGNRLEEDILCREELDGCWKGGCRVLHTLSKGPEGWRGRRGRITAEMVLEEMKGETTGEGETLVLICGPEPLEKSLKEGLNAKGWKDEDLLFF